MSKTNVYILAATALLGVLIYIITGTFGIEQPVQAPDNVAPAREAGPAEPARRETPAVQAPPATEPDAAIPVIATYDDLVEYLDSRGLDGAALVDDAAHWYQERGFLGPNALLGVTADAAPVRYFESLDDATLDALAENGDIGALQALAARAAFIDPFKAASLYEQAMYHGSIQATLQYSSMLDTLRQMMPEDYESDPRFNRSTKRLAGNEEPAGTNFPPFIYATVAYRDGGPALADAGIVQWLNLTFSAIPEDRVRAVCRRADLTYVAVAEARRARDNPPLNLDPPAVFLATPGIEDRLPCGSTNYPVYSIIDTGGCEVVAVRDAAGSAQNLHICPE